MKNLKIYRLFLLMVFIGLFSSSCSDDNNDPTTNPSPKPDPVTDTHFDIWVSLGKTSAIGSGTLLVYGTDSLNNSEDTLTFKGTGIDVTAKLFQESIIKGQYYYQIPKEKDRFGKYRISSTGIETIKEVAFGTNTYKDRRYSHTWIDDNTLVIIASNGDATKVIWTKINTSNMTITSEGTLSLPKLTKYSTSGVASYRASDNKIFYSYCNGDETLRTQFYTAVISASDMTVEKTVTETRAAFPGAVAYGELLQSKSFFDTNGDYYLVCNTTIEGAARTQQYGTLLRIKKGETDFDKSYLGFVKSSNAKGKIVTAEFLTTGKALLYIMDPDHTDAEGWGRNYNCYYAVLDLNSDVITELDIPYSEGNFSQRSVVVGNKAYIGANPEKGNPCVYVYDIPTGKVTKGLTIKEGFSFDRVVLLEN